MSLVTSPSDACLILHISLLKWIKINVLIQLQKHSRNELIAVKRYMELTSRVLELLVMPNDAQKKKKRT